MEPVIIEMQKVPVSPQIFSLSEVLLHDVKDNVLAEIGKFDEKEVTGKVAYYSIRGGPYEGKYCLTESPPFAPDRVEFQLYPKTVTQGDNKLPILVFIKEGNYLSNQLLVRTGKAAQAGEWKERLKDRRESLKDGLGKDRQRELHSRVFSAPWLGSIEKAKSNLSRKSINQLERIVQDGQDVNKVVFDNARDEIDALKNTPPNPQDWKNKLNQSRENAKKKAADNIDRVFDNGINYIDKNVPSGEQDAAADLFEAGTDLLSVGLDFFMQELLGVLEDLEDLLKKVWDQVTNFANGVINIANSIGDAISSIFG